MLFTILLFLQVKNPLDDDTWLIFQGSANLMYVATSPDLKGVSGKYFSDMKEISPNKYASDDELGRTVMKYCEDFITSRMSA